MQIILTSRPRDLTQPWVREIFHYNVEKFFTYDYSLFGLYNFFFKQMLLEVHTMILNTVKMMILE